MLFQLSLTGQRAFPGESTRQWSWHSGCQRDCPSIDDELAVTVMVDRLRVLLRRIDPGFDYFENEQVVLADKPRINDLAFEVGKALGNERRGNLFGRNCRQTESLELVHILTGAVANAHNFAGQFARRNGDDALFGGAQGGKTVVGVTDNARNQRRREFNHHVPGHRHDIRAAFGSCGQQNYRPRFKQLVDLRQWQVSHDVVHCNQPTERPAGISSAEVLETA